MVSGDCGILTTPAASLIVEQAVTFISQPTNKTVCPGSDATFSVSVNGSNLTYEWQKNTVPIGGATNPDYTIVGAVSLRMQVITAVKLQMAVEIFTVMKSH